jgi:hypothetical protein
MPESTTRHLLERQRASIRGKLREIEPNLMRELESVELALGNLGAEPQSDKYAKYKFGTDAIMAYLEETQHTATGEVIASAVVNGGWLRGNKRAKSNLLQAIFFSAINNPDKKKQIRRFGGGETPESAEIGLYHWDDSYRS